MAKLSNQPPKGTNDWLPAELKIRQYIFNTWRQVCQSCGYQEYLTPIIEAAEIYQAKSGEDVGGKELMMFQDKAGRNLAIRPEMTPSITRLVSRIYNAEQKPIRYFSIANFLRNEKPQRGRNREFWQLNFDIFGSQAKGADLEIMQMALDIMLAFQPPAQSFFLAINSRELIEGLLTTAKIKPDKQQAIVRLLDKWGKLPIKDWQSALKDLNIATEPQNKIMAFMSAKTIKDLTKALPELKNNQGLKDIQDAIDSLSQLGYGQWLQFKPSVIRGFDYYDGLIFEVFDNHRDNNRSMFGGGRYNGLAQIFGGQSFPAVGCAPGDETTKLFLASWKLLDKIQKSKEEEVYYLPLLDQTLLLPTQKLAKKLRQVGRQVECGLTEQRINKALDYANKKQIPWVVILGSDESQKGKYKVKNMKTGQEKTIKL
ncbi:MAG: histidine--tRNA ligase [bacterium]